METRDFQVTIPGQWKEGEDGIRRQEPAKIRTVAVSINWEAIAERLGIKAARSVNKVSRDLSGLVVVRAK